MFFPRRTLLILILLLLPSLTWAEAPLPQESPKADKWTGYTEFLGQIGTDQDLGEPDLFAPIWQDDNDLTFFNLRGQFEFNDTETPIFIRPVSGGPLILNMADSICMTRRLSITDGAA